jgi:hypothetical protein
MAHTYHTQIRIREEKKKKTREATKEQNNENKRD